MCCSPNRVAVRAATHYCPRAFAKPKGNNVLQPEPRSGEGCNTLLPEGLANVNALGKECYIVIVIYLSSSTCTFYLFIYLFIYLL